MAMSSTARDPRNDKKRTDEAILEVDSQFIAGLRVFSGDSDSVSGLAGGNAQNSPQAPAGNYLAREGDSMIGPIALGPPVNFRVQIGTEEEINISALGDSPQYSSNIELDSVQPNGFVLDRIDGAAFDGQILIMRTFGPDSFTISQATLANGGNIQTPSDDDFELAQLQMIILVFDEALQIFANTGGTWRVLSGAGSGGTVGTYASVKMDQDQIANLALNNHIQFNDYVENGGIVLQGLTPTFDQTSGIFELKAGKTYFLYGDATAEFGNVNDTAKIAWWDITNGVQLGQKGSSFPFSNSSQISTKHAAETIFTPVTDVTVELRIVNLSGTITTIFADDTQANIFEFSGKNGATGPPGPAGSGLNWKLPARAKSTEDVPNLAIADVIFDGITLIEDDRVLLTDQTTESENGLWQVGVVAAGFAPLTRPTDFDTSSEVVAETFVPIEEGTIHNNQLWHLISNNPLTIDVSPQLWDIFAPGISGGPDLGGGEDGIDAAGEFVNDGRISTGAFVTQRWDSVAMSAGPGGPIRGAVYIPAFGERPARIVVVGVSVGVVGSCISDDLGDTWSNENPINTADTWQAIAYDGTGREGTVAGAQGVLIAGSTDGPNTNRILRRSVDRGENWSTITAPNTDNPTQVLFSLEDSQFVMVVGQSPATTGIWTSPDASTWTVRTTPAPTENVNAPWRFVAYSPSLDLYLGTTGGDAGGVNRTDVMTSSDGITWTRFSSNIGLFTIKQLIWSEGQQKFVILSIDPVNDISYTATSPDGINWSGLFEVAETLGATQIGAEDIVWAPNLSLFVVTGYRSTVGHRLNKFWVSNDAETWSEVPRMPTTLGTAQTSVGIYSEEYTKFISFNSTIGTTGTVFRTTR